MERLYDASDLLSLAPNPLCLFDQVKIGFSGRISGLTAADLADVRQHLDQTGVLDRKRSRRNPRCIVLDVPIITNDGEVVGHTTVELWLEQIDPRTMQITSRSTISTNLVVPLRALLGIQPTDVSLDGKLNYIGPTAEQSCDTLNLQFDLAHHAVEAVCEAIGEVLPACAEVHDPICWLRAIELHHDLNCDDALKVTRAVCHTAMAGSRLGEHDSYRSGKSRARVPVAHWRATRTGEVVKVYPKTYRLARVEVGCRDRESIAKCCGERRTAEFSGAGIAELLYAFYEKAAPTVTLALDHVQRAALGKRSPMECMLALQPLLQLGRRERSGTNYTPSAAVAAAAQHAGEELLSDGVCHIRGHRKGSKLREVLDTLTEGNGPLMRGAQGTIYCLRPEFGRAAAKLADNLLGNDIEQSGTDDFQGQDEETGEQAK